MTSDARAEMVSREERKLEADMAALRAAETEQDRELATAELLRKFPDMSDEDLARALPIQLDRRRLHWLAERERACLEVIRFAQCMSRPDENRDPMYLSIPARAIMRSSSVRVPSVPE